MYLYDYIDQALLDEMIMTGYVSVQQHPTEWLNIYNYTHKAQYDRMWNDATKKCRGLIVGGLEGNIVAKPWPKFFNYGEYTAAAELTANEGGLKGKKTQAYEELSVALDLDAPCTVLDKYDGSLGILYYAGDGYYSIATRGSFTSEQALRGTKILREKYQNFRPYPDITYLFEIIYPENRIVLDYGAVEDLVLLDERSTYGEFSVGETKHWPGPRAWRMAAHSLREALALPPRPNAEGVVVRYDDGLMLKIKQEDYVALHRIVTGLNERVVWEKIGEGFNVRDICEGLPDEFAAWVWKVAEDLDKRYEDIYTKACWTYNEIWNSNLTRKEFAERAKQHPEYASYLFKIWDGKPIGKMIWKNIKPSGESKPREFSEATA